jgi:hypothetical protein
MSEQVLIEYRPALFFPPRSTVWVIGKITLVPGVKNYSLADWEELKTSNRVWDTVSSAIETGIIRLISTSTPEVETPSLPKNQQEAIALVGKTFSLTLLRQWQEIEKRKPVLEAINLQLNLEAEKTKDAKDGKPVAV